MVSYWSVDGDEISEEDALGLDPGRRFTIAYGNGARVVAFKQRDGLEWTVLRDMGHGLLELERVVRRVPSGKYSPGLRGYDDEVLFSRAVWVALGPKWKRQDEE